MWEAEGRSFRCSWRTHTNYLDWLRRRPAADHAHLVLVSSPTSRLPRLALLRRCPRKRRHRRPTPGLVPLPVVALARLPTVPRGVALRALGTGADRLAGRVEAAVAASLADLPLVSLAAGPDLALDLDWALPVAPATSSGCGRWYSVGSYPSVAAAAEEAKEDEVELEGCCGAGSGCSAAPLSGEGRSLLGLLLVLSFVF